MKRLPVLLALLLAVNLSAQNRIDKSKQSLNEEKPAASNTERKGAPEREKPEDDNVISSLAEDAFMYTLGAIFKYGLIGDYGNEDHLYNDLTKYPFYEAEAGNFYNPKFGEGSIYEFRVDVEDKFLYSNSNLFANHLDVKIRPLHALYLEAEYYQLWEFQDTKGTSDRLSLFYFNFAYERIRFERFNFGWTLGASYIGSDVNEAGFAFGLNADYFLKKNISFTAGANWSFINGEKVHAYEAAVKTHRKNYFLSLGYERLEIAEPTYNFISLGGGIYF
jgi:hypothetical protein